MRYACNKMAKTACKYDRVKEIKIAEKKSAQFQLDIPRARFSSSCKVFSSNCTHGHEIELISHHLEAATVCFFFHLLFL